MKEVGEEIFILELYERCGLEYVKERFKVVLLTIYLLEKELKEEGKIISNKRLNMNGKRGKVSKIKRKKRKKNRYKRKEIKELREKVQIDTIHLRYGDKKLYVITGIDRVSRYVYAKVYKVLNSDITREFISEIKEEVPFNIKDIQTDNGLGCKNILINMWKIKK